MHTYRGVQNITIRTARIVREKAIKLSEAINLITVRRPLSTDSAAKITTVIIHNNILQNIIVHRLHIAP